MALDLRDCSFVGPALPEPFVLFELEKHLNKLKLLPGAKGAPGKVLQASWDLYRRKLRALGERGGPIRVANHIFEPLIDLLGYAKMVRVAAVATREGMEDGGWVMTTADGSACLRVWAVDVDTDLDAPNRRGRAYRFSVSRVAQRVLLASNERVGLLTDGDELRLLICDPARPDSHIAMRLDRAGGWRGARSVPDSFRLLLALACPAGLTHMPDLTEQARLTQTQVTARLREQARQAVEGFMQEVFDHPINVTPLAEWHDQAKLAQQLWSEGLILVYRLLFIFKLESSPDPARAFSFASTSLWRHTYSPNTALAPYVRALLSEGTDTGGMLEGGLRVLFRLFAEGLSSSELTISPLGGMLFGPHAMALLDRLHWGERAVALLLDRLLWTPGGGKMERQRVYYGPLDVEDLGRVYEALLELEPGIATEPMCRLRRDKLEVVVPTAQGEVYKTIESTKKKSKVEWIEAIPAHRFFLRVGLGRKASGSYYTPHAFVRFLVQETLGPQVAERSPTDNPQPAAILQLNVLDPAMGSGHFLVEACRYLGDQLYEACRLCDELASAAEEQAELAGTDAERTHLLIKAQELRQRVEDLPDPQDELVAYLPSRVAEGEESGLSQRKAIALSRRLVAVHCLYGVDKNPLAVELAKLSLWLESYAEGLPLTFLDHRLICGDSLTGPFFEHLLTYPGSGEPIDGLFAQGLTDRLTVMLNRALAHVKDLEASVGKDVADVAQKQTAKAHLDAALAPFKLLAAAWSGGVMLGQDQCDDTAYESLLRAVSETELAQDIVDHAPVLSNMVKVGQEGIAYDLVFPEVFHPAGTIATRHGFDGVLGNPPWDTLQPLAKEFYAAFDLRIIDAPTRLERASIEQHLTSDASVQQAFDGYVSQFERAKRFIDRCYQHVSRQAHGQPSGAVTDLWQVFAERGMQNLRHGAHVGWVLPSAFHANQSATGIRSLYLDHATLKCCYSFENRKRLFDIDSRFKFAPIVAQKSTSGPRDFPCAFYLHELDWLFQVHEPLRYSLDFVRQTGGDYLSFLELRSPQDAEVAKVSFAHGEPFGEVCERFGIRLGRELHMTDDSGRFTPIEAILPHGEDPRDPEVAKQVRESGYLALHEGKTFHQYDDHWEERPRYLVHLDKLRDKPAWLKPSCYYRLAFRDIARSTDERTGIFCMVPAGVVFGHKAINERNPEKRPDVSSLVVLALANSFSFDFLLRCKVQASVSLFMLNDNPLPPTFHLISLLSRFLAHAALRLTCNHEGYAVLWHEQLGHTWREPATEPYTWPVLDGEDARWAVRSVIDAVVANAYGLSREQYEHVLSTFSHSSYPKAPELCLAAFDDLQAIGLDAFARKHDPYWDIPLHENLPRPVIDFPQLVTQATDRHRSTDTRGQRLAPEPDHGPLFQHAASDLMAAEHAASYGAHTQEEDIDPDT